MASFEYATVDKIAPLERINTDEDKYMEPNEKSARVRISKIEFVADGAQSDVVVIGRFDGPVELVDLVLNTDDDGVTVNLGVTPQSAPDDADTSLGSGIVLATDVTSRAPLAINYKVTEPSYITMNPSVGDFADASVTRGYILYVDNS